MNDSLNTPSNSLSLQDKDINKQSNNLINCEKNIFPVDAFPPIIQEIIFLTNSKLNFPIDFIGSSMLFATSIAIGNSCHVELKKEFVQNAVIYIALVGNPGINKSHPLSFAIHPIQERDNINYEKYIIEMQKMQKMQHQNKKDNLKFSEPSNPIWKRMLLSDFTPEALVKIHSLNHRGLGIYADELAGWFKNFNRYNKGSEQEFWLTNWSNKPITIDRKSDIPMLIKSPFISVAGTIQTGLLNSLFESNRFENGFIDRILFAYVADTKKKCWTDSELPEKYIKDWQDIINKILELPLDYKTNTYSNPKKIHFELDAKKLLYEFQKELTNLNNEENDDYVKGIYSKLELYLIRLPLILEMMSYGCKTSNGESVSIKSVQGSIKLINYFIKSAIKIRSIVENRDPLMNLNALQKKIYISLPNNFKTNEGLKLAEEQGMPKRTFHDFIKNKELFEFISHGNYKKNSN